MKELVTDRWDLRWLKGKEQERDFHLKIQGLIPIDGQETEKVGFQGSV